MLVTPRRTQSDVPSLLLSGVEQRLTDRLRAADEQVEKIFFQIWAPSLSLTTFYEYSSAGVGKGVGASMSVTLKGPFNDFSTTSAISTTDFSGAARFTTSGVGPFSVNFLNLMGLPSGVATMSNPLKIDTGFTVGLGLSTSLGNMLSGFTGPFLGP